MLRNAFTAQATVDFSQIETIVLLSEGDTPPASHEANKLYIKKNEASQNYFLYLRQVDEENLPGFDSSLSIPLPANTVPREISEGFAAKSTSITAGHYNNSFLSKMGEDIDPIIRVQPKYSSEEKSTAPTRQYRTTFCEKTVRVAVYMLGGFIVGAGIGEGFEPLVNKSLGHEFDQQSDIPFFMVTGSAGFFLGAIASCITTRLSNCSAPASMTGFFARFGRSRAVDPQETSHLAAEATDTSSLLPRNTRV